MWAKEVDELLISFLLLTYIALLKYFVFLCNDIVIVRTKNVLKLENILYGKHLKIKRLLYVFRVLTSISNEIVMRQGNI